MTMHGSKVEGKITILSKEGRESVCEIAEKIEGERVEKERRGKEKKKNSLCSE